MNLLNNISNPAVRPASWPMPVMVVADCIAIIGGYDYIRGRETGIVVSEEDLTG